MKEELKNQQESGEITANEEVATCDKKHKKPSELYSGRKQNEKTNNH
jgi:hypothetical protein